MMYIKDCIITRFTSDGMYKKKGKISANSLKKTIPAISFMQRQSQIQICLQFSVG